MLEIYFKNMLMSLVATWFPPTKKKNVKEFRKKKFHITSVSSRSSIGICNGSMKYRALR